MDFENPHYQEIAERIRKIIQEDAHLEKGAMGSIQRCFAVKPEINGLLDVARRTYSELIEDIQKIVEQLSESYDLPVRLNQNIMKGFHIVLPVAPKNRRNFNVEDLPDIFIQVNYNGTSVTMTTEELVVLDHQAKESLNEIQKMSNIVISELLKELRPFMSSLYKLCENVAELDIIIALAQASTIGSYIRPEFNRYLEIRNSVHPLLDYNSQVMPVPNDIVKRKLLFHLFIITFFASPEYNFTIITGPNMGGKSIYIKQIAIMQIMAQLGCFLPATNAVLRLCDRLFSRIGFNDSVELNASTYVYEMKETQHILKGLTSSSLIIIDELCRGTCSEEGTSIAWVVCEQLILSDAFTFFTTHFLYLTRLQDLYYNVVNRHTVVTEEEITGTDNTHRRLIYHHKVEPGVTKIEHYGLALAAKTNLPEETVNLARELAELIAKNITPKSVMITQKDDEELLYKLQADIKQKIRKEPNNRDEIKEMLRKFKTEHPLLIETIKSGRNMTKRTFESILEYSSEDSIRQIISRDQSSKYTKMIIEETTTTSKTDELGMQCPDVSLLPEIVSKKSSHKNNENDNYTSVSLSTELLNAFPNNSKVFNEKEIESIQATNAEAHNNSPYCKNGTNFCDITHNNNNLNDSNLRDITVTSNEEYNHCVALTKRNVNSYGMDVKQLLTMENETQQKLKDTVYGTDDVADALTQIIDECPVSCRSSSDSCYNISSDDEELMQEAINDINKDLEDIDIDEHRILTPPLSFRDT